MPGCVLLKGAIPNLPKISLFCSTSRIGLTSLHFSLTQWKNCQRTGHSWYFFSWHSTTHLHIHPTGTPSTSENLLCICAENQPYTLCVTFSPFWKMKSKDDRSQESPLPSGIPDPAPDGTWNHFSDPCLFAPEWAASARLYLEAFWPLFLSTAELQYQISHPNLVIPNIHKGSFPA